MKTIDTRIKGKYNPLIIIMEAILLSAKGTSLEIITDSKDIFKETKAYLIDKEIGVREIYDEDKITLQFKV